VSGSIGLRAGSTEELHLWKLVMKRFDSLLIVTVFALLSGISSWPASSRPQNPIEMEELIRRSSFIFRAEVEKLAASNLKMLPATNRTVLVRVLEVLDAPVPPLTLTEQVITVHLVKAGTVELKEQAIFFANGWLYGENTAVTEVTHFPARAQSAELRKQIADVRAKVEDEKLQARIARATLVVVGTVADTRPLEKNGKALPITEHDADWHVAYVKVEAFLKGERSESPVAVVFPASTDVMWRRSPKFRLGQEGIWILEEDKTRRMFPELGMPAFAALDPLDFRSKAEIDRIRHLVAGIRH